MWKKLCVHNDQIQGVDTISDCIMLLYQLDPLNVVLSGTMTQYTNIMCCIIGPVLLVNEF